MFGFDFSKFEYKLVASLLLVVYSLVSLIIAFCCSNPDDLLGQFLRVVCILMAGGMLILVLILWRKEPGE